MTYLGAVIRLYGCDLVHLDLGWGGGGGGGGGGGQGATGGIIAGFFFQI